MKKLFCIILIILSFNIFYCLEANALFGNTHFNLGKIMLEQYNEKITEDNKKAFLSGLVYADIGRFKFDNETGINSDSEKFYQKIKELAVTSEEKWFAYGFEMHYHQDKDTGKFLTEIFGRKSSSYSEYILDCSLIDSYFLTKNDGIYNDFLNKFNFECINSQANIKELSDKFNVPEGKFNELIIKILNQYSERQNKYTLVLYDELIRKTYQSFGFDISIDDIHEQAANIVGSFIVTSSIAGKKDFSEDFASKVKNTSTKFANLYISKLKNNEKSINSI